MSGLHRLADTTAGKEKGQLIKQEKGNVTADNVLALLYVHMCR